MKAKEYILTIMPNGWDCSESGKQLLLATGISIPSASPAASSRSSPAEGAQIFQAGSSIIGIIATYYQYCSTSIIFVPRSRFRVEIYMCALGCYGVGL